VAATIRDPADEFVIEAAVNGQAVAIVAFNRRDSGLPSVALGLILLPSAG
jgi:hypothetical protein